MTTGKRIPINNHGAPAGHPGGAPGGHPAAHRAGRDAGEASAKNPASATATKQAADKLAAFAEERAVLVSERNTLAADLAKLTEERDALSDSLLRLRAEFENFRRRASREMIDNRVNVQCEVLGDFLPVLDNLERALDAAEHHEEGKVLEGVRLTRNMFADLLSRTGVQEIEGVGVPFDPQVHEAVAVSPADVEEGAVAAVLERGYRQGERVLRPARVIVSAGPPGGAASAGPAGPGHPPA